MEKVCKIARIILLVIIIILAACGKQNKEHAQGKWYSYSKANREYEIQIHKSGYTEPLPIEGALFRIITVSWRVVNKTIEIIIFGWDNIYLIDEYGTTYVPASGIFLEETTGLLEPGQGCKGVSTFLALPHDYLPILKCGLIGDVNGIQVQLKPEDLTELYKRDLNLK
jgi:hypothetical protein